MAATPQSPVHYMIPHYGRMGQWEYRKPPECHNCWHWVYCQNIAAAGVCHKTGDITQWTDSCESFVETASIP